MQAGGILCLLLIRNIAGTLACLNSHRTNDLVVCYLATFLALEVDFDGAVYTTTHFSGKGCVARRNLELSPRHDITSGAVLKSFTPHVRNGDRVRDPIPQFCSLFALSPQARGAPEKKDGGAK
jgi:hypothetical protein